MQNNRNLSLILAMVISLTLCFIGFASGNDYSDIAGKWYLLEESLASIEFFEDGTLQYNASEDEKVLAGTWSFLDDGRLKVWISPPTGGNVIGLGELSEDSILLDLDGDKKFVQSSIDIERYFPLKSGLKYVYNVTSYDENVEPAGEMTQTVNILPEQTIDGIVVTPIVTENENSKITSCYRKKDDGIYWVKSDIYDKSMDATHTSYFNGYIFRQPLVENMTWKNTVTEDDGVYSQYVISLESTDDFVETESAKYSKCIRISTSRQFESPMFNINQKTLSWFAPNVGYVKAEVTMAIGTEKMKLIKTSNLESFTK